MLTKSVSIKEVERINIVGYIYNSGQYLYLRLICYKYRSRKKLLYL